jgi:hypothetical protein
LYQVPPITLNEFKSLTTLLTNIVTSNCAKKKKNYAPTQYMYSFPIKYGVVEKRCQAEDCPLFIKNQLAYEGVVSSNVSPNQAVIENSTLENLKKLVKSQIPNDVGVQFILFTTQMYSNQTINLMSQLLDEVGYWYDIVIINTNVYSTKYADEHVLLVKSFDMLDSYVNKLALCSKDGKTCT